MLACVPPKLIVLPLMNQPEDHDLVGSDGIHEAEWLDQELSDRGIISLRHDPTPLAHRVE